MQPVGPLGGALAQRRVAGRDEAGIGRGLGAGEGEAAAAPGRTLQRDGTHAGSMGPLGAGSPAAAQRRRGPRAQRNDGDTSASGHRLAARAFHLRNNHRLGCLLHGVQLSTWSSSMSRARIVALSFVAALALGSGALAQGGGGGGGAGGGGAGSGAGGAGGASGTTGNSSGRSSGQSGNSVTQPSGGQSGPTGNGAAQPPGSTGQN